MLETLCYFGENGYKNQGEEKKKKRKRKMSSHTLPLTTRVTLLGWNEHGWTILPSYFSGNKKLLLSSIPNKLDFSILRD